MSKKEMQEIPLVENSVVIVYQHIKVENSGITFNPGDTPVRNLELSKIPGLLSEGVKYLKEGWVQNNARDDGIMGSVSV